MSWELKKLNEIVLVKSGKRLPKGHNFVSKATNHPYIRARDIKNGKIKIEEPVYISENTFNVISRYTVSENDLVITIVGANVGDIAFVDSEHDGANLTENAAKLTPKDSDALSPKFLKYSLFGDVQKSKFQQIAMAAAQPKLGLYKIKDFEISTPPLQTQKRIADILSAYDDLIENNLKRIKLLEQAAQNIYKEWFVNLRFPGHENTPINNETGLPEGWEEKALGEFTQIKKGKNITKSTIKEGNVPVVAGGLKPAYYHNTSNTSNPVITVSASGANAGYVNMYLEDIWASDCSYIDSKLSDSVFFIHNLLSNQQELIFGMQRGAAQPHVYPKDLKRAEFVIPDKGLIQKFEEQVSAQYDMKRVLNKQNQKLKAARDILLPRLMNRTIEV
ncbi:restriction endonuclease subunit S [uncultured Polaribacter sp.]|uniref:restriction endonuclease subunit S n=1 Tax=uncultured Polaribacter sp. TaxID=174711 RepID=UPI00262DC940|nr:restriction endonuclease subunit S [uncultured Polaribacter sp.]